MSDPGAAGLVANRPPRLRLLGLAGGVALVTNAGWELGQRPLYATDVSVLRCLSAAVVDTGYTVAAVAPARVATTHHPRAFLPAVIALLVVAAVGIETWALATDRWLYAEGMPRALGLGLSPLVQLPLLGAVSAWAARRLDGHRSPRTVLLGRRQRR
ncbi:MAG TPA: hypothetical protein VGV36_06515 [Solirubrobacteraceae bacterium]|nr:hypothetical protein [Solirubrobacteraceae bacterium]